MNNKILFTLIIFCCLFFFFCKKETTSRKPIPGFYTNDTVAYVGSYIKIIDTSKNFEYPATYHWTYEGGRPSYRGFYFFDTFQFRIGGPTDIVAFDSIGTYSISLTIRNNEKEETITKKNYIRVIEDPLPAIYVNSSNLPYTDGYVDLIFLDELQTPYECLGSYIYDNKFKIRTPDEYIGKTVNLYCESCGFYDSDILYISDTVSVTLTNKVYINFFFKEYSWWK
ncbi:MAG: hypothetical protein AB7S54_12785 [Bacteroidales bacterium]